MKQKFDNNFQYNIARIIVTDKELLSRICNIHSDVQSIFDNAIYEWFVRKAISFYEKYGDIPDKQFFLRKLRKQEFGRGEKKFYFKFLRTLHVHIKHRRYYIDEFIEYLKFKMVRDSISQGIDELNRGSYSGVIEKVIASVDKGIALEEDRGLIFFKDLERGFRESVVERGISSGISSFDRLFRGNGITKKKLFVIMAPPGKGKTAWLVDKGYKAILQNKRVLFVTLELSENEIFERFASAFTGISLFKINGNKKRIRKQLRMMKKYRNNLVIKEFSSLTVSPIMLERYVERLNRELDFFPELILVDYADLMKPIKWYKEKREALSSIYLGLKRLAQNKNVAIWTASQTNRQSLWSRIIDIDTMWEDFGKAMIADSVVALCMKRKEREENRARLYIAKNRVGIDGIEIPIKIDYATQRFTSLKHSEGEGVQ